jgi:phosphatidate cytidylyltransferase
LDSAPTGTEPAEPTEPPKEPEVATEQTRPAGRTGRNLPVAIGVGAGLGGLVVLTLLTVKATFLLYVGIALALALAELASALAKRDINIPVIPIAAGGAAVLTCTYWLGSRPALAALALSVVVIFAWRLFPPLASGALWLRSLPSSLASLAPQSRQRSAPPARSAGGTTGYVKDVTAGVFALAYIPFLASFVAYMLAPADGPRRVLTFVILTIASDIGGYFAGITLGRHKMAPVISPKKTWEGFGGSAFTCVLGGAITVPTLLGGAVWQGILTGLAVLAAATLGDLTESMMKRDLEIKDMGSILPGHGGVLDRLDSLLVSAPVVWILLLVFIPASQR